MDKSSVNIFERYILNDMLMNKRIIQNCHYWVNYPFKRSYQYKEDVIRTLVISKDCSFCHCKRSVVPINDMWKGNSLTLAC